MELISKLYLNKNVQLIHMKISSNYIVHISLSQKIKKILEFLIHQKLELNIREI